MIAYFLGPVYHMGKDTELQDRNETWKFSLSPSAPASMRECPQVAAEM